MCWSCCINTGTCEQESTTFIYIVFVTPILNSTVDTFTPCIMAWQITHQYDLILQLICVLYFSFQIMTEKFEVVAEIQDSKSSFSMFYNYILTFDMWGVFFCFAKKWLYHAWRVKSALYSRIVILLKFLFLEYC